jgi:choice-of-anchor B domain-containing protein
MGATLFLLPKTTVQKTTRSSLTIKHVSMKLKFIILSFVLLLAVEKQAQTYSASNFTLISLIDPELTFNPDSQKYSGCWGWYQATKNKEYAVVCSHRGTYWIDVTVAATPSVSAYRAGRKSGCTWREAKSYRNYLYVISDDFGNNSLQIFDMQYLPDSVHKVYDGQTLFARGHTLWVDGDKLYIGSATLGSNFSSMSVYSLANPISPVLLRKLDQDYPAINHVHDMYVRHDTVYASCGYQGLHIYKLTASNTFTLLGSLTNYPFSGYNHSSALTPNGQHLVFMDEVPAGLPIKVANVTNLANVQVLAVMNQFSLTTPHNPFMANNNYCFASSYQDGLQLFNISNPSVPFLAGYFDTHPQSGGNNNTYLPNDDYNGQWGAYPYLPSGNILALDRLNGAFMLRTSLFQNPLVNPGFAMPTGACLGATVTLQNTSTSANTFTWTFPAGVVATTTPGNATLSFTSAGTYTIALLAANPTSSASIIQTITISNPNITAAVNSTNAACATCSNGIISIIPTGGNSPYTYSWSPYGGTSATAANLTAGCYTVAIKDANGCKSSTTACIAFFVGLEKEYQNSASPVVYPNPAQTQLTIDYPGNTFDYSIYNKLGQLISTGKNNRQKVSISLNEFAKGIYLVEIESEGIKTNQKIIVE